MPGRRERAVRFVSLVGGTASIAVACWSLAGLGGVLLAVTVGIATAASTRYYGVAFAHLVILGLTMEPTIATVTLLEAGSFAYLVTELDASRRARDGAPLAVAIFVFTAGVSVVARDFGTLWAGAGLVAVVGGIGYILHRHGALRLGLLTEEGT
ncbi:hypothetical protein [Halopelagius longus]|uniref:DUF8163 domain-containing protein n=1 Tax=Halopelagius longus TaxID=1236180 RepID=A0A1H1GKJ5_9EURY|nr:hypothetical protein [Halopelagius longus]RDI69685.1 hypothetical protein DWB78_18110 [Halopelagius longus]SDR13695.1 hypothetical protein SAMN05216278_3732 [Halopelagius longus]